jgi:hypothetical protein
MLEGITHANIAGGQESDRITRMLLHLELALTQVQELLGVRALTTASPIHHATVRLSSDAAHYSTVFVCIHL